jgi:hypothetical protein
MLLRWMAIGWSRARPTAAILPARRRRRWHAARPGTVEDDAHDETVYLGAVEDVNRFEGDAACLELHFGVRLGAVCTAENFGTLHEATVPKYFAQMCVGHIAREIAHEQHRRWLSAG